MQAAGSNAVGPVVTGAGQLVVIQLGADGAEGEQDATGVFTLLLFEHDTVIHGNASGVLGVQVDTPAGPVTMGAGQVVSM